MKNQLLASKYRTLVIILMNMLICLTPLAGQVEPPFIRYISIINEEGDLYIEWEASPSPGVINYEAYEIKGISEVATSQIPLQSISGDSTSIVIPSSTIETNIRPFPVMVRAYTLADSSLASMIHTSIFLKIKYDSCSQAIQLNWTPYKGWNTTNNPIQYRVVQESIPISDWQTDTTYTVTQISENQSYLFHIEAKCNIPDIMSASNRCRKYTFMPPPPQYIYTSQTTANNDHALIDFNVASGSNLNTFVAEKSNNALTGFATIDTFHNLDTATSFTDNNFDPATISYYRISVLNSCRRVVASSNPLPNISLRVEKNEDNIFQLNWNPVETWHSSLVDYHVYQQFEGQPAVRLNSTDQTEYTDNTISSYENRNFSSLVCYYIVAEERDNPYGLTGNLCRSNIICQSLSIKLFDVNAFSPDGDGKNEFFPPDLAFIPNNFYLAIFNRDGLRIYESRDYNRRWHGTDLKGNKVLAGVYTYIVETTSFDGHKLYQEGIVTVVYPNK